MKKQHYVLKTLITIIATAVITFTITIVALYGRKTANVSTENAISQAMKSDTLNSKLNMIKAKINEQFIGDVDENNLKEYAIKGYVAGLNDVYSQYLTADEMKDFTDETNANFVGIGVYMTKNTKQNAIEVYGVIKDSPAEEVGIKKGDFITGVEGKKVTGDDFETIAKEIKGAEGSKVKVEITRGTETKEYEITRRKVAINNVTSQMLSNNVAYINIASFEGDISTDFENQYKDLVNKGAKSLIVDLRNNGGGLVQEALEIGDLFTDKDQTLLIETDKEGKETVEKAKTDKTISLKTVVLVNEDSASASEILAALLKEDCDNVTIVGTKTYGKGVIQTLYQLTDGSGLKITTNEYFTPKHNKINKIGITPDVEVEESKDFKFDGTIDIDKDVQLKKAIEIAK